MINFGPVPLGAVLPVFFGSYGKTNGESITLSGLAVTDIEIYKGTSMTQRASDAGYTLLDTDGIDVDGITGIHAFSIDTGDNTDAGFFTAGSFYTVVISAVTIDSQTINFVAATFRLVPAENSAGVPKVEADAAAIRSAVGLASANLDTQLTAIDDFIDTEVAAIKAKTDNLPPDPADASDIAALFVTVNGKLDAIDDFVDTEVAAIKAQTDKLTFDGANMIVADARKISTSATAADNLEAGSLGLVPGTCAAGSTTTAVATNLTEATDDHYNGRVITFTSGALLGQTSAITDYNGTTKVLTVTALTEAPANGDAFVIS